MRAVVVEPDRGDLVKEQQNAKHKKTYAAPIRNTAAMAIGGNEERGNGKHTDTAHQQKFHQILHTTPKFTLAGP